ALGSCVLDVDAEIVVRSRGVTDVAELVDARGAPEVVDALDLRSSRHGGTGGRRSAPLAAHRLDAGRECKATLQTRVDSLRGVRGVGVGKLLRGGVIVR